MFLAITWPHGMHLRSQVILCRKLATYNLKYRCPIKKSDYIRPTYFKVNVKEGFDSHMHGE